MKLYSKISILLSCLCISVTGYSQNFTFSPNKTLNLSHDVSDYSSNQIDIINQTSGVLNFEWELLSNTLNSSWSYSLCDLGSCYPSPPATATMSPTSAGGNAFISFHVSFEGVADTGMVQVFVYEQGDKANGDTITFAYEVNDATPIHLIQNQGDYIELYPNPANDFITLKTKTSDAIETIEIYSMLGEQVFEQQNIRKDIVEIPLHFFNAGTYMIKSTNSKGEQIISRFIKA